MRLIHRHMFRAVYKRIVFIFNCAGASRMGIPIYARIEYLDQCYSVSLCIFDRATLKAGF